MQVKPPTSSGLPRPRALLGQLADMDLRLLQVFKSVVECGGLSAAELELNIGTSTVSRHLKDLETRLGLTLCRRGRAGFALTLEGQRVYDETLRLLVESFFALALIFAMLYFTFGALKPAVLIYLNVPLAATGGSTKPTSISACTKP